MTFEIAQKQNIKQGKAMKNTKKFAKITTAAILSGAIALSYGGLANASTVLPTGTNVRICKTIDNVYENVSASFDYTFTAGTGLDASTMPSDTHIIFSNEAPVNHVIEKCTNVDLGGVSFTDTTPKLADITVNEGTTSPGFTPTSTASFTMTLQLVNTVDANNQITGQAASLAYITDPSATGNPKVQEMDFTATAFYANQSLNLTNTVEGTGGDTNKYFTYTVTIGGSTGAQYTVVGGGTGSASTCIANTACTIKLKSGESAVIGVGGSKQIPVGTTYSIVQSDNDYTTKHKIVDTQTGSWVNSLSTGQQTILSTSSNETTVNFVNAKDASVPTGIFLNLWPYILLGAASLGIIFYTKKNLAEKKQ
jgi:hypothetical protein